MRWIAVVAAGVLALAGVLVVRRRRELHAADVGAVSDEWIAQHRASLPDAFH